jgi:Ca-activated chloride channel family protein
MVRSAMGLSGGALVCLMATVHEGAMPAQQGVFRADTQLVPLFVTVTVTDKHKRLVTRLTAEDFEIREDGKPQPLVLFSNAIQPMTMMVMLDTSLSATLKLARIRAAAEQFVVRLLPGDRARLCVFNNRIRFSDGFTDDRDARRTPA